MIRKSSPRLPGYDYRTPGVYFVTIRAKKSLFGAIKNNKMHLDLTGEIAKRQWLWIATNFSCIELGEFCLMPDHLHGILTIRAFNTNSKNLSKIIGAFKTTSSKQIHLSGNTKFKWQRSYYDKIITNEHMLQEIQKYIINNAQFHVKKNTYV